MKQKQKFKTLLGVFIILGLFAQMSSLSVIHAGKPGDKTTKKISSHTGKKRHRHKEEKGLPAAKDSESGHESPDKRPSICEYADSDEYELLKLKESFDRILVGKDIAPDQMPIVDRAIEFGIHKNARYIHDQRALHIAVKCNNRMMVEKLVATGELDVNEQVGGFCTPVTLAVHCGHDDILNFLMEHGGKLEDMFTQVALKEHKITPAWKPLMDRFMSLPASERIYAHDDRIVANSIFNENIDLLKYMLDSGYNVNKPDARGNTPMHIAAQAGSLKVMEFLWNSGARTTRAINTEGRTPLHIAVSYCHTFGKEWACRDMMWDWHINSFNYNPAILKFLINADPDSLSIQDFDGFTPLNLAVKPILLLYIYTDMVRDTVDLKIMDFFRAFEGGNPFWIQWMLNIRDARGQTPLHVAAANGNIRAVQAILEYCTPEMITATDNMGKTAEDLAKSCRCGDIVSILRAAQK